MKRIKVVSLIFCILFFGILYSCNRKENGIVYLEPMLPLEEQKDSMKGIETNSTMEDNEHTQERELEEKIYVHVCGAVNTPNVYQLEKGTRTFLAIELAGGYTKDADINYINQAILLEDGQQIYVPTKEETKNGILLPMDNLAKDNTRININMAHKEELMTLPGIGEAKAESIISYRTTVGVFHEIEDIMDIAGIKESVFEKIKDKICVK